MEIKPYANNFEKLKTGTLIRNIQKEIKEPGNTAIGQVSKELRYIQRQSQYVGEIERVMKELKITFSLIKECRTAAVSEGSSKQEMLAYHQGNFFNLVHQMKDKIGQLVNLMTEEEIPEKPSVESDISINDLLTKKAEILKKIGIEEQITQWEQEDSTSNIAVVLRKRTWHHHRVSGLRYDKDFLNLGFTDIAIQPSFQGSLTDYGKQQIEKMRQESTDRLFSGAVSKAESTMQSIQENVEKISEALVNFFKLPISQEEISKIMAEFAKVEEAFDVVNKSSYDKITEPHKSFLEALVTKMRSEHEDKIVAIYLVGSLGRGDYEEGYSDINLYVIFRPDDLKGSVLKENGKISLRCFTEREFLSEQSRKFRIIAKADGILVYGTDIAKSEKLPKAGMFLALTLNNDIIDKLDEAKNWAQENPNATPLEISAKSKRLAKRLIDFIYGVVMTNKPQYTANRKERVERIIEMYPDDKNIIETLMGISRYGVGEFESFKNTIEGFRPRAEENLKKMQEVKEQINKTKK